ncbi:MAG: hypothetical protein IH624_20395 [Phycisphaerae bacterium]|nr:hypothetical protein [Phycisphaerae bacterium]
MQAADTACASEIVVDATSRIGTIRPLHGVNNGPLNFGEMVDVSAWYRQLDIPLARLHDCEWPNPDIVDIHAIFPDMQADASQPLSYRFSRTDDYIRPIVEAGTGIVYRLGESIEHTRRKYHVVPPGDYAKWADVCIGIIRHYNEGWADGHQYGIRYWEIWNEPENRPVMWTGSDEDYYRLYAASAKAIKNRWPRLMVGGPSAGAQGRLIGDRMEPYPFVKGFLEFCRDNKVPLDFFSWHTYTDDPYLYAKKARAIRRLLDEYGFTKTESHLNEWNYLPDNEWIMSAEQGVARRQWFERIGGAEGAAFLTCALIDLQTAPVDVANYYSGDTNWFGLFDRYGLPRKTFYAMKAFRMLLDTPAGVKASGVPEEHLAVCAGINEEQTSLTILVSSLRAMNEDVQLKISALPWKGPVRWEVFRLDARHSLERVLNEVRDATVLVDKYTFEAPCVLLVRLSQTESGDE